jgi:hypothetical protein
MSFPISPANNQEAQVNGIIYVWNATKGAWRRKPGVALGNGDSGDQIFNGNIIANSGARATSVTTGAIQVTRNGGVGVTGNVWAGAFYSNGYFYANGNSIVVQTASTSNSSGNLAGGSAGQLVYQQAANVTSFVTNGDIGKILASNGPGNMPIWVNLQELASLTGSPYITQLLYPSGNVGASDAGGETVYAIGSGFQPGFTMSVNNAPVLSASYITSSNVAFVTSPTAVGNYTLTVTNPNRKFYNYNYIEFIGAGFPYFLNPPGYLNFVAQNLFFNQYILVAGGYKPYNFQITSGALPGAMTIDAGSGLISGYAPSVTDPTSFNFTVRVTDAQNQVATRNFYILVTVPVLLSNQMRLSSRGSDYIRASDADANVSIAHTMSLSSRGSDYIRASTTLANSAVKTMTLSSQGSDFIRAADADVNVAIAHTMTLSSQGSDFIRAADADVNVAIAHTMTLSSTKYHVATASSCTIGANIAGGTVIGTTVDNNGVSYCLILSPYNAQSGANNGTDLNVGGSWPEANKSILGTDDNDGYYNTQYIPTTSSNGTGYTADYFRDLTYNGYSDWYWPSHQELVTLSNALKSGVLTSDQKGPYLDSFRYWSSTTKMISSFNPTTFTYYAWAMDSNANHTIFSPRSDGTGAAMISGRVRAVRRQII